MEKQKLICDKNIPVEIFCIKVVYKEKKSSFSFLRVVCII